MMDPAFTEQTEKPYQAPFARLSSLDDAATHNLQSITSTETIKASAHKVSDMRSSNQIHETLEKAQIQKGLRKILNFGRKGHNSHLGDGNLHSYESVVGDEMGPTPNGVSSPVSILSPIRLRSNEKKVVASA